jgi:glc operon protein GlcG
MIRNLAIASALALTCASSALAQSSFAERAHLTAEGAKRIVDACMAFAAANNAPPLAIAVVDTDGVLLSFHMMEGGGPTTSETAILKAETAAHWRRSTRVLEETVVGGGNQASLWIGDFPKAGGLPVMIDGVMAGAVGVGGPELQDECAQAGIDAAMADQQQAQR